MKPINLQLKRLLPTSAFTLAVVLFPLAGLALEVQDVPNPRQINGTWVTDMTGMLDQPTQAQINSMITQLERQNGAEIAVVTVPETSPSASPKEFTTALFNYWKIGKKGENHGVLILISKSDRRVEIETGYGVESILPDAKVANIINTKITPKFKQGDFNGGTLNGTKAIVVALENPSVSNQPKPIAIAASTPTTDLAAQPPAVLPEPTQDANIPWGLVVGGGLVTAIGVIAFKSCRVSIEPEGRSRFKGSSRFYFCTTCKKRMEKVDDSIIQATLSKPEQVAQKIGSLKFYGWKCPNCSQQLTGAGYHRVACESRFGNFCECPTCDELTVTHTTQILERPTEYSTGIKLITNKCHCCDYQKQWEELIPRLPPSSSSSSGSSSGGDSGGGGGGFGGGDSGGGGAGGSW